MPDALCGGSTRHGKRNFLIEFKVPQTGKLNYDQIKFHHEWRGQIAVVRTVDDLLALLK